MRKNKFRIVYSALKYNFMKPEEGFSFEHYNFYDTLRRMQGVETIYRPYDRIVAVGRDRMNEEILDLVKKERPDLFFAVLFRDELKTDALHEIKEYTQSIVWMSDDHWRFDIYSKYYAPHFSWVATTDSQAPRKYRDIGYTNVIKTQWACNHFLYKPVYMGYEHDVTFVGQPHSNRRKIIETLLEADIKVSCFGRGWRNGPISQEKMIKVFSSSKINLNMSRGSGPSGLKTLAKIFLERKNSGHITLNVPGTWLAHWRSAIGQQREQIKGRNFEIPGCGGFLLTSPADNIEKYYVPGQEIVIFRNVQDLIEKIHYYLDHEEERERIARAGYERTLRDHTYEKRFRDIFDIIGLS